MFLRCALPTHFLVKACSSLRNQFRCCHLCETPCVSCRWHQTSGPISLCKYCDYSSDYIVPRLFVSISLCCTKHSSAAKSNQKGFPVFTRVSQRTQKKPSAWSQQPLVIILPSSFTPSLTITDKDVSPPLKSPQPFAPLLPTSLTLLSHHFVMWTGIASPQGRKKIHLLRDGVNQP